MVLPPSLHLLGLQLLLPLQMGLALPFLIFFALPLLVLVLLPFPLPIPTLPLSESLLEPPPEHQWHLPLGLQLGLPHRIYLINCRHSFEEFALSAVYISPLPLPNYPLFLLLDLFILCLLVLLLLIQLVLALLALLVLVSHYR